MRLKLTIFFVAAVGLLASLYLLSTQFDRGLADYARIAEGHESEWSLRVDPLSPEEARIALYAFEVKSTDSLNALKQPTRILNAVRGGKVHGLRSNGFLYIVLHKWVNFSAGVCIPIEVNSSQLEHIEYIPIRHSKWMIWKNDLQSAD